MKYDEMHLTRLFLSLFILKQQSFTEFKTTHQSDYHASHHNPLNLPKCLILIIPHYREFC